MDDHLGVRFAQKLGAPGDELLPKLGKILDNSVMYYRETTVGAHMRVGVGVVGRAVGRPAGVTYAGFAAYFGALDLFAKVLDFAGGFDHREASAAGDGDSRGVVPAVLELFKSFQQYGSGLPPAGKSDYTAHNVKLLSVF